MRFKHDIDKKRFVDLPFIIKHIAEKSDEWCNEMELEYVITATWSTEIEDKKLKRKSKTHLEKRAIDVSSKGWTNFEISEYIKFLEDEFNKYGAISNVDGKRHVVIFHNSGNGEHFHIQICRESFKLLAIK